MSIQPVRAGSIVHPGEGRTLPGILFRVAAAEAAGAFSIVEHPYPPGVLIPPHVHDAADQVTYVIEGEIGVRVGDDVFLAAAGAYVIKPRGIPHTHWNATHYPARVMEITTPGAFETFFDELGALLAQPGPPDPAALGELGQRHATRFVMEWVPELTRTHSVRLLGS
jgi:quercetin dioxygenase-like cupin family protein